MPTEEEMMEQQMLEAEEIAKEEALDEQMAVSYPKAKERESIFKFLSRVMAAERQELSKVSNIKDHEIRAMHELRKGAQYAEVMGLSKVADFFNDEADSYLSLSDSRDGFLLNNAITQRKEVGPKSSGEKGGKKPWFSRE